MVVSAPADALAAAGGVLAVLAANTASAEAEFARVVADGCDIETYKRALAAQRIARGIEHRVAELVEAATAASDRLFRLLEAGNLDNTLYSNVRTDWRRLADALGSWPGASTGRS